MTDALKFIVAKLLDGHYIIRSQGWMTLYQGKHNPVRRIRSAQYAQLYPYIKSDRKGRITLNLNIIRSLHGNSIYKRLYKRKVTVTDPGVRRRRKIATDAPTLF